MTRAGAGDCCTVGLTVPLSSASSCTCRAEPLPSRASRPPGPRRWSALSPPSGAGGTAPPPSPTWAILPRLEPDQHQEATCCPLEDLWPGSRRVLGPPPDLCCARCWSPRLSRGPRMPDLRRAWASSMCPARPSPWVRRTPGMSLGGRHEVIQHPAAPGGGQGQGQFAGCLPAPNTPPLAPFARLRAVISYRSSAGSRARGRDEAGSRPCRRSCCPAPTSRGWSCCCIRWPARAARRGRRWGSLTTIVRAAVC